MTLTETPPETTPQREATRQRATLVEELLGSGDHTIIGRVFIFASLLMGAIQLAFVAIAQFDLGIDSEILDPTAINRFELNTPFGLLLSVALPLMLGLAIAVVPLQVGSPSIAFPRAAGLSLWAWLIGSVFFVVATVARGAFGGSSVELGQLGLVSIGLMISALLVGAVCVVVTVLSLRTAGQTIAEVPHFAFSMLVACSVWVFSLPAVIASVVFWHIQHPGPDQLLEAYPQMAWVFGQPAIFVAIIPVLGIVADGLSAMTGQPIKFFGPVQAAIGAAGLLSFGAWAQVAGANETIIGFAMGVGIVLPIAAVVLLSAETLSHGKPTAGSPLLFVLGAALVALLGGAISALAAINTIGDGELLDVQYGLVGAQTGIATGLFYLLIGAAVVGGIGGAVLWSSRIWDAPFDEKLAMPVALLAPLAALLLGAGPLLIGIIEPAESGAKSLLILSGVGAALLALCAFDGLLLVGLSALNAFKRSKNEEETSDEDASSKWSGGTLEWAAAVPPVNGNFAEPVPVVEGPYPLFDTDEGES